MTPSIRAVLVDDEPRARARLRRLLEAHADVAILAEAGTADEALARILASRPDVVFLDVRMPGRSGTELAEQLMSYLPEGVRPAVVFTTAHAEHAVEAFALQGLDYLLKPIEPERLADSLRRVRQRLWARAPGPPAPPPAELTLTGHHGTQQAPLPAARVVMIALEDGVAMAHTRDGDRVRLGEGLAELEATLPSPPFVRVSRAAIVHLERARGLRATGAGTWSLDLEGGLEVAVSRRRAKHVRDLLGLE